MQGEEAIVLAIPPDGVPVAAAVAAELNAPFDLITSRRIVSPRNNEETLGAVTPDMNWPLT